MRTSRRTLRALVGGAFVSASVLAASSAFGQEQLTDSRQNADNAAQTYPINDNGYYHVYLVYGVGQNVILQTGEDGSVLVNSGAAQSVAGLLSAIKPIIGQSQPIRYVVNTSAEADAAGGNAGAVMAGRGIYYTGPTSLLLDGRLQRDPTILGSAGVSLLMAAPPAPAKPLPPADWPTLTFESNRYYIYFNREPVELYREAGHDNSDTIVFFRGSDVIAAGNIIDADRFPMINVEHGGSIQGEIAALDHIIELSDIRVPFVWHEGGTYIVPAYGRIYQQWDVVQYRDMLLEIEGVIQDMIRRKLTLQQIEAARPCLPYETQYGRDSGLWTTNDFVEAVYRSLVPRKAGQALRKQ